jgi:PAS domain S-box-containing protein
MLAKPLLPTRRARLFSWPAVAAVLLLIQAALSFTVRKDSTLSTNGMITYFFVLVLAAGIATLNAIQNTEAIRIFWSFLATALAVWSVSAWSWIHSELGFGGNRPAYLVVAAPLFLHIVLMIAAVVSRPHLKLSLQRGYRTTLNFLLLLFFWVFAYAFLLVKYPYTSWDAALILRGQVLYLAENMLLLVILGVLIFRAQPPWKSMYRHLLGASALYLLGSLIVNIVFTFRGLYASLQYIPFSTAAACWFVWVALRGRRLAPQLAQSVQPDTGDTKYASLLALVSVIAVPVIGVWELFRADEPYRTRVIRLLIVLLSVFFLAVFAFVKEYLANRELSSDVGVANERLRSAMESGKAVGWEWDLRSGRDSWFGDLKTMFGIESETYFGRPEDFHRYVHPEDRKLVSHAVADARINHRPYAAEFRVVWPDGTLRWASATGKFHYSLKDEPVRMLGMAVDITDRKQAEEELRESEERLRLAVQAGRMYAFEWDTITDVIVRSGQCGNILNWMDDPARDTGRQFVARVHTDDRQAYAATETGVTTENPAYQTSYRMLRPDGSVIWLQESGHAFFDGQGRLLRTIGMVVDVTERKLAEAALASVNRRLIEAQERERTRIARELHDDVGQRLALLTIELEQLGQNSPDLSAEVLSRIGELQKQTSQIVTDVQSMSHQLHSSKLEYLGIVTAIRGFCKEFSEQQKVEIDFVHHDIPSRVPQEISLCLFRVLQEALQNAVKHSGVRHFDVELCYASDAIHLTTRDSGSGFDVEQAMKTHGLGLTSMAERMKLVDGQLSIDSQPNRGTTIHARVPLSPVSNSMLAAG